jgi:septal ring factor EnvC (AmiA/AmiB activator)
VFLIFSYADWIFDNSLDAPKTNDQMRFLQEELEAQWERTEKAEEELKNLRKENAELKASVMRIQDGERSEDINAELADRLNEMLSSQQALEEERDQVSVNWVLLFLTDSIQIVGDLQASRRHSTQTGTS